MSEKENLYRWVVSSKLVRRAFKRRIETFVMVGVVIKRLWEAVLMSKPEMAVDMVKCALSKDYSTDCLIVGAWCSNKTTLRLTQSMDLTAILRSKRTKRNIVIVFTSMERSVQS